MKMKALISCLSLALCSQLVQADHHGPGCMNKKNAVEMNACWTNANKKLDEELSNIWTKIQAVPKEKATFDKQKLTESQNLWMQFRQADCSKINQGSISALMNAKCYYLTTKTRIHELKHLCKGLGDTPIC